MLVVNRAIHCRDILVQVEIGGDIQCILVDALGTRG